MIPAEYIRWAVAYLDPVRLARVCWRSATPDRSAAVGLDAKTGELAVLTWPAGAAPPPADGVVVLCICLAHRRVDVYGSLSDGVEVAPSPEVLEETVVRHDAVEGVYWPGVERQLAHAGRAS